LPRIILLARYLRSFQFAHDDKKQTAGRRRFFCQKINQQQHKTVASSAETYFNAALQSKVLAAWHCPC